MYFNRFIGIEKEENKHIKVRQAVRAIGARGKAMF